MRHHSYRTWAWIGLIAGLGAGSLALLSACDRNTLTDVEEVTWTEPPEELVEMMEIRDEIRARVVASGITRAELQAAYATRDESVIKTALGFEAAEYAELEARLDQARRSLIAKSPAIETHVAKNAPSYCATCGADAFFGKYSDAFFGKSSSVPDPAPRLTCEWVQYGASLALCSLGGPVWYWPCAYVAMCSFCEGGWMNTACM